MFAPQRVGQIIPLKHVVGPADVTDHGADTDNSESDIYLEVLSLRPRVFDLHNFFSKQEAEDFSRSGLGRTT